MQFLFNAYSSPLLFGFVQAWVYAILLWVRGRREERLSDILLGWVLVGMGLNIWEYMLGFGGIEILWRELEFFPRTLGYLFPALCYFYLKSQINADFRFSRRDAWHTVPFLLFVTYHVTVFSMGPRFVEQWKTAVHYPYIEDVEFIIGIGLDTYYLLLGLRLYRLYRAWIKTQFSETETISFRWFRNFLVALTVTTLFSLIVTLLSITFGLNYWQKLVGRFGGCGIDLLRQHSRIRTGSVGTATDVFNARPTGTRSRLAVGARRIGAGTGSCRSRSGPTTGKGAVGYTGRVTTIA